MTTQRNDDSKQALCLSDAPIDIRYRRPLEAAGCVLATELDLQKGMETSSSAALRLIVLHTQFPDSDGLRLLKTLASAPQTAEIPVFVISNLTEQRCIRLLDAGAIGFCHRDNLTREVLDAALRHAERRQRSGR